MKLVFDIVKSGSTVPAQRNIHFNEAGGSIGRSENCDWVLQDTQNYISGHHLSIICVDDTYFIKDESTNGTFLKHPYKKLPKGHPVKINASDIFIVGDHEIQARYSYNEYAKEDVIGSISKSQTQESIIPNDDFLFESESDSFGEIEANNTNDILDLLDDTPEEDLLDDMFDTVIMDDDELFADIVSNETIGDDFNGDTVASDDQDIDARIEPFDEHFNIPSIDAVVDDSPVKQQTKGPDKTVQSQPTGTLLNSGLNILEEKLQLDLTTISSEERERVLGEVGDIVMSTLEHLGNAVQIKEKVKQDLRLSATHFDPQTNNPVMLGSPAIQLLQQQNSGLGMTKLSEAIHKSIMEISQHSVALHSATKNMMNITVMKFAPKQLQHRFESNGTLHGESATPARMWKAYTETFDTLHTSPELGVEMIEKEFSKEYENINDALKLNNTTVIEN